MLFRSPGVAAAFAFLGSVAATDRDYTLVSTSPPCARSIIENLGSLYFFQYVVSHCIPNPSSPFLTVVGSPAPGPEGCLTNFIVGKSTSLADPIIPLTGFCRESIQKVVTEIVNHGEFEHVRWYPNSAVPAVYRWLLSDNSGVMVSTGFYESLATLDPLGEFQLANNISIQYPACSPSLVRLAAEISPLEALIEATAINGKGSFDTGFGSGSCSYCYYKFSDLLKDGLTADAPLKKLCGASPGDALCVKSTPVTRARNFFTNCAGYDIAYSDPGCSSSNLIAVNALNPHPYFAIMQCAFRDDFDGHPSDYCAFFDEYLEGISTISSPTCGNCYMYFALSIDVTSASACSFASGGDYWNPLCIAQQSYAFIMFFSCAGSYLQLPPKADYSDIVRIPVVTAQTIL